MSYKHTKEEIELCREIGISPDSDEGCRDCGSYDNGHCYCNLNCDLGFKLLLWHDCEHILRKYESEDSVEINLYKKETIINMSIKNDYYSFEGKTSLEAGLKAIIKIAKILNIPANKLLDVVLITYRR